MGEDSIFPHTKEETLSAGTIGSNASAGNVTSMAAPASDNDDNMAVSLIAQKEKGSEINASIANASSEVTLKQQEHSRNVSEEKANSQTEIEETISLNVSEQSKERSLTRQGIQNTRNEWNSSQRELVNQSHSKTILINQNSGKQIVQEETQSNIQSQKHIQQGNKSITVIRTTAENEAATQRNKANEETSSSGFWGKISSGFKSFFNAIKKGIQKTFEAARKLVHEAIEKAQKLTAEIIRICTPKNCKCNSKLREMRS